MVVLIGAGAAVIAGAALDIPPAAVALIFLAPATLALAMRLLAQRSAMADVRATRAVIEEIAAEGRLHLRCEPDRPGDVGALNDSINDVLENFESVIRDVATRSTELQDMIGALDRAQPEMAATSDGWDDAPPEAASRVSDASADVPPGLVAGALGIFSLSCAFEVQEPGPGHRRRFPRNQSS